MAVPTTQDSVTNTREKLSTGTPSRVSVDVFFSISETLDATHMHEVMCKNSQYYLPKSARTCARFCARFCGLTTMMLNEIGHQKCTVWLMYIFFDAITHVSLTDDYFFTTNDHKFTRIDASFHLRIASSTFLRGDECSSSRRNVLITAEKRVILFIR